MDLLQLTLICGLAAPAQQLYGIAQVESQGQPATVAALSGEARSYPDIPTAAAAAAQLARDSTIRVGLTGVPMPKGSDAAAIQAAMAPCKNVALAGTRWATLAAECPKEAVAACVAARWHDGPPDTELADRIIQAAARAPKMPAPAAAVAPTIAVPSDATPAAPAESDEDRARASGFFAPEPAATKPDNDAGKPPADLVLYPPAEPNALPAGQSTVLKPSGEGETQLIRPARRTAPPQR